MNKFKHLQSLITLFLTGLLAIAACTEEDEKIVLSDDASLSALTVSSNNLHPNFHKDSLLYNVISGDKGFNIAPTTTHPNATVKVNGEPVQSGHSSQEIMLTQGYDTIKVEVTAEDKTAQREYKVVVKHPISSNAKLEGCTFVTDISYSSTSPFTPYWGPDNLEYELKTTVASMKFVPVSYNPKSTITINNKNVESGTESEDIPLKIGKNELEVKVVSEDKSNESLYKITITRDVLLRGSWNLNQVFTSGNTYGLSTRKDLLILTQGIDKFTNISMIEKRFGLRYGYSFDNYNSNSITADELSFMVNFNFEFNSKSFLYKGKSNNTMDEVTGEITDDGTTVGTFTMSKISDEFIEIPTIGIETANAIKFDGSPDDWNDIPISISDPTSDLMNSGSKGSDIEYVKFSKNTENGLFNFLIKIADNVDTKTSFELFLRDYDPEKNIISNDAHRLLIHHHNGKWYTRPYQSEEGKIIALNYVNEGTSAYLEGSYPFGMFDRDVDFNKSFVIEIAAALFEENRLKKTYDDVGYRAIFYWK